MQFEIRCFGIILHFNISTSTRRKGKSVELSNRICGDMKNTAKKNRKFDPKHFRRYSREWAMQFLFQEDIYKIENLDESIDVFLNQLRDKEIFEGTYDERTFRRASKNAVMLIRGVLDNLEKIDGLISQFSSKWTVTRMDLVDKNVMRVAIYEMFFCDNIPPIVSINEAVEIGKIFGTANSASFINGILNSIKNTLNRSAREAIKKS